MWLFRESLPEQTTQYKYVYVEQEVPLNHGATHCSSARKRRGEELGEPRGQLADIWRWMSGLGDLHLYLYANFAEIA